MTRTSRLYEDLSRSDIPPERDSHMERSDIPPKRDSHIIKSPLPMPETSKFGARSL